MIGSTFFAVDPAGRVTVGQEKFEIAATAIVCDDDLVGQCGYEDRVRCIELQDCLNPSGGNFLRPSCQRCARNCRSARVWPLCVFSRIVSQNPPLIFPFVGYMKTEPGILIRSSASRSAAIGLQTHFQLDLLCYIVSCPNQGRPGLFFQTNARRSNLERAFPGGSGQRVRIAAGYVIRDCAKTMHFSL